MSSLFNNRAGAAAIIAATTATVYVLYKALDKAKPYSTLLLRGPLSPSYLKGHQELIVDYDINQLEEWLEEYGAVFRMDGYFGRRGLCIADPKAAAFITSRPLEFSKPKVVTQTLLSWTGPGLFATEGEAHKKQVRGQNTVSPYVV